MFGNLTLAAFRHDLIEVVADLSIIFGGLFVAAGLTYYRRWTWLWREWLTSLDPKKIGVMYAVVAVVMLLKGIMDAVMMRLQQVLSVGDSTGYITPNHFNQLFTAHGTTMIFFVAMGLLFAAANLIVPLQIGARDVAFPFLNSVSFYFFASGAVFILVSLIIGHFSNDGWLGYPPLTEKNYSPGVGVDYWIWSIQISGIGSLFSGINFLVTILKMRHPGMTLMKMPIFVWTVLGSMSLVILAFPVLTVTLALLSLDRLFGMHFFTSGAGGNPMMFVNLIWAWGHPEVYILILPAFGVFSEVVPVFSQKRLFGYRSMVWAIALIVLFSFTVWLHHFFTMGAGGNVNGFFAIATMLIAIPTGVKVFNWLFTMFRGRIRFATPMLWFLGFVIVFCTGGMTGVLMAVAPVDFQVHNSLFLVAHFHSMVIGGVVFGFLSGFSYWFPKFTGFKLNETLGKYAFGCWIIGFLVAFMPLYILGLMGATRRLHHYEAATGWQPYFIVAGVGALIICLGVGFQVLQMIVSILQRDKNRDLTGNPWNATGLEWSTTSPPPFYNFPSDEPIQMPKNTCVGLLIGAFGFLFCFGVIWYIHWLSIGALVAIFISMIVRLSDPETEYTVSKERLNAGH